MNDLSAADAAHLEAARLVIIGQAADEQTLYRRWFQRETGDLAAWPSSGSYRAAMLSNGRFQRGWQVVSSREDPPGTVTVRRDGLERAVAPPEIAPEDPHVLAPGRGAKVLVFPLASGEIGGFWHIWSAGWQAGRPEQFWRIYFRVGPSTALELVARFAAAAPSRQTWAMKALCRVHDLGRRDGALLYLPAGTPLDSGWVKRLIRDLATITAGELPPFVEALRPGIGWAPDPGGGRSFGEAVAATVASARNKAADPDMFAATAWAAVRALPGMDRRAVAPAT